ncbi:MAG: hypothetical protein H6745_29080 [Deltaproteobacteria bacterium]|nr:hypothetical protein [Deltaproteobacteria bacterium]
MTRRILTVLAVVSAVAALPVATRASEPGPADVVDAPAPDAGAAASAGDASAAPDAGVEPALDGGSDADGAEAAATDVADGPLPDDPGDDAPVAPVAPETGAAPAPATGALPDAVVRVVLVTPDGAAVRVSGAEVVWERWASDPRMRGASRLEAAWSAFTDDVGRARFAAIPAPGPGRQDQVRARYHGVTWPATAVKTDGPMDIVVYEPTTKTDALTMSLEMVLQPGEGDFNFQVQATLRNRSLQVVDTTEGQGVRIPLPQPILGGLPVDWGFLPAKPDPNHFQMQMTPEIGSLYVERGAVVYHGPIPPGDALTVTVAYSTAYDDGQSYTFGFTPSLDTDRVILQASHPTRIAPRIAFRGDYVPLVRQGGAAIDTFMTLARDPKAGEPVYIEVARIATRRPVIATVARVGAGLTVAAFVLLGIAMIARRRAAAAAGHDGASPGGGPLVG